MANGLGLQLANMTKQLRSSSFRHRAAIRHVLIKRHPAMRAADLSDRPGLTGFREVRIMSLSTHTLGSRLAQQSRCIDRLEPRGALRSMGKRQLSKPGRKLRLRSTAAMNLAQDYKASDLMVSALRPFASRVHAASWHSMLHTHKASSAAALGSYADVHRWYETDRNETHLLIMSLELHRRSRLWRPRYAFFGMRPLQTCKA